MSTTLSREPRRNRQFWLDHVERWQRSGLSKTAYCDQQNIKPGSFYNWSGKTKLELSAYETPVAETIDAHKQTPIQFHPVKLTTAESDAKLCVRVERAATDVTLPTDLTPEQIEHWLSAIHRLDV